MDETPGWRGGIFLLSDVCELMGAFLDAQNYLDKSMADSRPGLPND